MKLHTISDVVKILILAASILITCLIISLGFRAAKTAKEISNSTISQMNQMNEDIKLSDLKKYASDEVYGSEVVNFITKYLGNYSVEEASEFYVTVKTSIGENTYYNGSYLDQIKNFSDIRYIKPTTIFHGKLIRNDNQVIIGISFIQI